MANEHQRQGWCRQNMYYIQNGDQKMNSKEKDVCGIVALSIASSVYRVLYRNEYSSSHVCGLHLDGGDACV